MNILLITNSFLSKIIGFLRESFIANHYGACAITDAFFISLIVPNFLIDVIGVSFYSVILPEIKKHKNKNVFISSILYELAICIVIISILLFLFSEKYLLFFRTPDVDFNFFLKKNFIFLNFSFFFIINSLFFKYLNYSNNKFLIPSYFEIIANLVNVLCLLIFFYFKIKYTLILSYIVANFIHFVFEFIYYIKTNFNFSKYKKINIKTRKILLYSFIPIFVSGSANYINKIVDKYFALNLAEGYVSYLQYSLVIYSALVGVFIVPLVNIAYNNFLIDKEKINIEIKKILFLIFPIILFVFFFSEEIVCILFQRKNFNHKDAFFVTKLFNIYFLGFIFESSNAIFKRYFWAIGKTKNTMIINLISIISNILINFMFINQIGVIILPISTSVSVFISFVMYSFMLRKKIDFKIILNEYYLIIYFLFVFVCCVFIPNKIICLFIFIFTYLPGILFMNKKGVINLW